MKFHCFWSSLGKSVWLFIEKSAIAPPGKNPYDAHDQHSWTYLCVEKDQKPELEPC